MPMFPCNSRGAIMPSMGGRRGGMSSKDIVISTTYGICSLAQLILSFIYYDHLGLDLLTILGLGS